MRRYLYSFLGVEGVKIREFIACTLVGVLILSSTMNVVVFFQNDTDFDKDDPKIIAIDSAPIRAEYDIELQALGLPGLGTEDNPYRIEFLDFNLDNESTEYKAIYLYNTSAHVLIQNCSFSGWIEYEASGYPIVKGGGVYLWNVQNCVIANNSFSQLSYGIWMMGEKNIKVISNTIEGTCYWDEEHGGLGVSVQWNQLNSSQVVVERNSIRNCALGIDAAQAKDCIFQDNYIFNCSDGIGIRTISKNVTVLKNICTNCTRFGIWIATSNGVIILNNSCNMNGLFGIWLDKYSTNITISFNEAMWNGNTSIWIEPLFLRSSITLSQLREACGIWVDDESSGNTITWNDIAQNKNNAFNDGTGNIYDFNYWSDYEGVDENGDDIGDIPYQTGGYVSEEDIHPRLVLLDGWDSKDNPSTTNETSTTTTTTNTTSPDQQMVFIAIGIGSVSCIIVMILFYRRFKE